MVRISIGAHNVRPRAAKGRPYSDSPQFSLPQSALQLTAPSSERAKEKSLPLTREVAGRRPDGGRDWAVWQGAPGRRALQGRTIRRGAHGAPGPLVKGGCRRRKAVTGGFR